VAVLQDYWVREQDLEAVDQMLLQLLFPNLTIVITLEVTLQAKLTRLLMHNKQRVKAMLTTLTEE